MDLCRYLRLHPASRRGSARFGTARPRALGSDSNGHDPPRTPYRKGGGCGIVSRMEPHDPQRRASLVGAITAKNLAADRSEASARYFERAAPVGPLDREALDAMARRARERARALRAEVAALAVELATLDRGGRCGARCRSKGGAPCKAPRVKGKRRCKLHGGLSTGPRTAEGRARALEALTRGRAVVSPSG